MKYALEAGENDVTVVPVVVVDHSEFDLAIALFDNRGLDVIVLANGPVLVVVTRLS